jgi:hypothetical protein
MARRQTQTQKTLPAVMQTQTAIVACIVCCPVCKNSINASAQNQAWNLDKVKRVGMFKVFECPYCFTLLQLPLALFMLHIED